MRTRTGLAIAVLALAAPVPAAARTINVTHGHSIQAAVNRAHPGDTVKVHPGTYTEKSKKCPEAKEKCAVIVRRNRIRLVAAPKKGHPVVLKARKGQAQGIHVGRAKSPKCLHKNKQRVKGSLVRGFRVRGFSGDGVLLWCVDNWRITRVRATDNNEYGLFPVFSGKGRVDHNFASDANDTGIYIGQSHDVHIDHNTAKRNVSGFEIENSAHVRADHNRATGNTAGILSFALPGLLVKKNRDNRVDHNVVHSNNKPNTCLDPGDVVCNVPRGSGILLVATKRNTISNNDVKDNDTVGIALVSYCIIKGEASGCTNDIDPLPRNTHIVDNVATGNAGDPDPTYAALAADLVWDTTGTGNCWSGNTYGTTFPSSLPAC